MRRISFVQSDRTIVAAPPRFVVKVQQSVHRNEGMKEKSKDVFAELVDSDLILWLLNPFGAVRSFGGPSREAGESRHEYLLFEKAQEPEQKAENENSCRLSQVAEASGRCFKGKAIQVVGGPPGRVLWWLLLL